MARQTSRRPPPEPPKLKRSEPTVDLPRRLVIVCEGATEADLLDRLRQTWKIAHAKVAIIAQAGDPLCIVDQCIASRAPEVDVWAVFDRDEHDRWGPAVEKASANKVRMALSNPCVELFGILLHEECAGHIERGAAQSRLKKIHPKFDHKGHPYLSHPIVLTSWEEAERRADALQARADANGDPRGNPTTRLADLIRVLSEARPSHLLSPPRS